MTSLVWPVDRAPDDRYQPIPELVAGGLAERISTRLGGVPLRIGRSTMVIGLASRLWSLLVVSAVRDDELVDVSALVARDDDGALVLGLAGGSARAHPSADDVDAAARSVLDPVIDLLPLAPRLLWGNVAASLNAVPRVHRLPAAEPLVRALLDRPPYAGELDDDGRRRTCCLFYEVPGAGLCGDCVFDAPPRRSSPTDG